jgi:hypothetical protein
LKYLFNYSRQQKNLFPFYLFITILVLSTSNCTFFWDKDILISRQAFWFFENGFKLILPQEIDSGHPPFMGMLLAFLWKFFGKTLIVGHLAMLPFALGLVWQSYKFLNYFIKSKYVYLALVLVLIDTSILTQVIILTGDLLILFFFLLCINSILNNKKLLLAIGSVGLGISSARGMISCIIIILFHLYFIIEQKGWKNIIRHSFSISYLYIPSVACSGGYLLYHYFHTGWMGYDPANSNWAGCFELVNFQGFVRNIFILFWRLIDFGRIFIWLLAGYFFYLFIKGIIHIDRNIKLLSFLFIISIIIYSPMMLIYKVLNGHRYILPVFIIFSALVTYILFEKMSGQKLKYWIFSILLVGLISGNFWVYPDKIAKGWDATLAHIPYYKLRVQMIKYIDDQNIPFTSIGSDTPNTTKMKFVDLSDDERSFQIKDFNNNQYIFYSNIYNTFTDSELQVLKENWIPVKEFRLLQVYVKLYKNPKFK